MRDLNKVLIVAFADVDLSFPLRIHTTNDLADFVFNAVIDDVTRCFVEIVSNIVITVHCQTGLLLGSSFDVSQVFNALQSSVSFVVPMVGAFERFTVN